jgi:hypothetical protein
VFVAYLRNHSCYAGHKLQGKKKNFVEFDQASFANVEVIPFIEEQVVVIDIPNFDLDITST